MPSLSDATELPAAGQLASPADEESHEEHARTRGELFWS
jgi:hypothetical protein